ncbi:MAG: hypothetical protein GXX99_07095 [Clostridiales bacterium]|nr:hypothetical protein [Clostridiales bacterium]
MLLSVSFATYLGGISLAALLPREAAGGAAWLMLSRLADLPWPIFHLLLLAVLFLFSFSLAGVLFSLSSCLLLGLQVGMLMLEVLAAPSLRLLLCACGHAFLLAPATVYLAALCLDTSLFFGRLLLASGQDAAMGLYLKKLVAASSLLLVVLLVAYWLC